MKTYTHESPQTNEWQKTDSEGALLGFQPPTMCDVMIFQIARAHHQELRSNLASYRNDGDKEIANANNSQTVCVCICLVICFLGIWYRGIWLQNLFVFVLYRCTWFVFFESVRSVLYPRECHLKIQTLRSPFTCKRHTRNYPRRQATYADVCGSKTLKFAPSMTRSAPFG